MSMTQTETIAASGATNYGGFADAIGGIATIFLAIVALAGVNPGILVPVAVTVFGAALLVQGGAILSEHAHILFPAGTASAEPFKGGNLSAVFMVGIAGIVLGVLALLGVAAATLTAVSIIAFGTALVLSANSVRELHIVRRPVGMSGSEFVAGEMASDSAGAQLIAGLTAVVLGILAVAGVNPAVLMLSALIVLGAALVLSGSTLSGMVLSFMRPTR
jgi:hypothetical protein